MILFTDEDIGTSVPRFLRSIGLDIRCLIDEMPGGTPDVDWLADIGQRQWLALSCNRRMLNINRKRQAIIQHRVGIVFLTSGQAQRVVLTRLILNKWSWFERIDATIQRPFAFMLPPNGRTHTVQLR